MSEQPRFKIDFYQSSYAPFGFYVRRASWFGSRWERLDRFETKEAAQEFYDKIKDLPEYLT
jgi:hypothetical protein